MVADEPRRLAVVRTLTGSLEEQPLKLLVLLRLCGDGDLVLRIIAIYEVK